MAITNELLELGFWNLVKRYIISTSADYIYCHDLGVVAWLIDEFWIGWLDLLTPHTHNSRLQAIQRYRWSTHALRFWVFTSRILATDLSHSHCYLKSHMKSSCHSQIPFFPLFCSCQFRRLDWIQFLCSQAHILAGWRLETLFYTALCCRTLLYNHFARTAQKTQPLLLRRRFTDPLPSGGCPIVARVGSRGNVFTESLPSNGSMRQSIIYYL
jgi:hypothetical protein